MIIIISVIIIIIIILIISVCGRPRRWAKAFFFDRGMDGRGRRLRWEGAPRSARHLFLYGSSPLLKIANRLSGAQAWRVLARLDPPPAARPPIWRQVPRTCRSERPAKIVSGPETGKRKRVTRKADGKLTLLVNLGRGSWHEKLTLLVTHFSLPISGPLKHRQLTVPTCIAGFQTGSGQTRFSQKGHESPYMLPHVVATFVAIFCHMSPKFSRES